MRRISRLIFACATLLILLAQGAKAQEEACPVAEGYREVALHGVQRDALTGQMVHYLGDVNGDGIADYAVAAPSYIYQGRISAGLIYVIYGNPWQHGVELSELGPDSPPDPREGFIIAGSRGGVQPVYWRNGQLAAVGDLDGDGYDDFVLGDYGHATPQAGSVGAVYVFYGGPVSSFPAIIDLALVPTREYGDRVRGYFRTGPSDQVYGEQVAALGDIDGDGRPDFAVSLRIPGTDTSGMVYVYHGQSGRPDVITPDIVLRSNRQIGALRLGLGLAGKFDFDHDGVNDIMVCAIADGNYVEGYCYIFWGATMPLLGNTFEVERLRPENGGDGSLGIVLKGGDRHAVLGEYSRFIGDMDLNGDGLKDIVFGSPNVDGSDGSGQTGRVYVVYGHRGRPPFVQLAMGDLALALPNAEPLGFVLEPDPDRVKHFGQQVESAGDVNGDGIDDLLIAAPRERPYGQFPDPNALPCGTVWVIHGRNQDDGGFPPLVRVNFDTIDGLGRNITPAQQDCMAAPQFGISIATLPDFTGDGRPEWLIGSHTSRRLGGPYGGEGQYGKACLYLSSEAEIPTTPPVTARAVDAGSRFTWFWLAAMVLVSGVWATRRR